MKTNRFKKLTLAASLLLVLVACKKIDPPKGGGEGGEGGGTGGDPVTCGCKLTAKGTIESCPQDASIWFINAYQFPYSSFAPVQTKLLLPVTLPAAYKVNGLTVSFDYSELPDSVALHCWMCETPPIPYARKIKLCKIRKDSNVVIAFKPVIYLYPQKTTKVNVELNYKGHLTVTYPEINEKTNDWDVIAQKDGSLKNLSDHTEHQYLFWEGAPTVPYNFNMKDGFCIKGTDTRKFLQTMLPKLGLTPKEYNDMIVFWLPKMMNNTYNLVHFATEDYTQSAPLNIIPKPDNLIRVFMAFQPCNKPILTKEPLIITPKRSGFTVVEWGGTELPPLTTLNEINF
jgi:hypothetical protein